MLPIFSEKIKADFFSLFMSFKAEFSGHENAKKMMMWFTYRTSTMQQNAGQKGHDILRIERSFRERPHEHVRKFW